MLAREVAVWAAGVVMREAAEKKVVVALREAEEAMDVAVVVMAMEAVATEKVEAGGGAFGEAAAQTWAAVAAVAYGGVEESALMATPILRGGRSHMPCTCNAGNWHRDCWHTTEGMQESGNHGESWSCTRQNFAARAVALHCPRDGAVCDATGRPCRHPSDRRADLRTRRAPIHRCYILCTAVLHTTPAR